MLFSRYLCAFLAILLAGTASVSYAQTSTTSSAVSDSSRTTETAHLRAIDARDQIKPEEFAPAAENTWESEWKNAEFPFDELIYYWNAPLERGEGIRMYLQVQFEEGDESPWLYAGYWGQVPHTGPRRKPRFDRGVIELDQLLLKEEAKAWRFRVVSEGRNKLSKPPFIGVITTDNEASDEMVAKYRTKQEVPSTPVLLDIPLRKQIDIMGKPLPDRCQSAALASALQYFGTTVPIEQIISHTSDPEYEYVGIWPRTLGAAHEFGFEAYLDRFRDWESVKKALSENKVILCSQTMPKNDTYIDPPYPHLGGHIVALSGVTDDGRVIVVDSAGAANDIPLLQWRIEDYEKIWMRNKGGVGMVICPPDDAKVKPVEELPDFPDYAAINAKAAAERAAAKKAERDAEGQ